MPGAEDMPVAGFHADRRWGFSSERLGITFHGNTVTQGVRGARRSAMLPSVSATT